jgi:flagellar biosynthesis/type III secretory pathway chaperone
MEWNRHIFLSRIYGKDFASQTLFDYTCDEYGLLLKSDIDAIPLLLDKKQAIIDHIHNLEKIRTKVITDLNNTLGTKKINNVTELIIFFEDYETSQNKNFLFRYNSLLIEVIEKIRKQNRKNQIFINKSLASMKALREEVAGIKSFHSYNNKGAVQNTVKQK